MSSDKFWTLGRRPDSFELADLILSWTGNESSPRRIRVQKEHGSVLRTLVATNHSFATTVLRLALGLVFFVHSVQNVMGWFGSFGFSSTMSFRTGTFSGPTAITVIAVAAEFLGALSLIVGFVTRLVAAGLAVNIAITILMVDGNSNFFMDWSGVHNGAGFEFHLLALAIAFFLIMQGAGAVSVDGVLLPSTRESYQPILDMSKTIAVGKIRLLRRLS
jgi:putative oxidoreductase